MFRYRFVFILVISATLSSCMYFRTNAYLRKDTIKNRIEQSQTPIIVVLTLPSQLCIDKPNEINSRYSNICSQYSALDWYPIDLILSNTKAIVTMNDKKKLDKIYDLYKYGEKNFNLSKNSNLQIARFSSLSEYQQFKQSHSFLEYRVTDYVLEVEPISLLSCLTLFVLPWQQYEFYDVNVMAHNPSQEPKRVKIYQTHHFQTVSWFLFIWGAAISDPPSHFEHYTILSPAAQLIEK